MGERSTFVLVVTWWLLDYLVTFKFCVTAVCIDRIDCDTFCGDFLLHSGRGFSLAVGRRRRSCDTDYPDVPVVYRCHGAPQGQSTGRKLMLMAPGGT